MEVSVRSALPPGSGAGTSAAVAVALLGALAAVGDEPLDARAAAYAAHRLEVDVLGGESGIQDQLCAALGGVNFMEIDVYPEATVHPLPEWNDLDDRLTLVYLGRPHDSSAIHRQVIAAATTSGFGAGAGPGPLDRLRGAALAARDAIIGRDVAALGRAMIDNTDAQDALHPSLVSPAARRIIDTARSLGAIGWKVNGAGGEGGSLTLLSPDRPSRQQLQESLGAGVIPIRLSAAGLVVT
jgi:D-glycero-alpha-D-manno-heptose-7-phosphate kinase